MYNKIQIYFGIEGIIMLNLFQRAFKDERKTKALIGLNLEEFNNLSESFGKNLEKSRNCSKKEQKRAPGGGRKHTLSIFEKLFFILYYLKTYPTYGNVFFKRNISTMLPKSKKWNFFANSKESYQKA
jgi:hypothetical protein